MAAPIPNGGIGPVGDFTPTRPSARPERVSEPTDGFRPGARLEGLLKPSYFPSDRPPTQQPKLPPEGRADEPAADTKAGPKSGTLLEWENDFHWGDFKSAPPAEPARPEGTGRKSKTFEEILKDLKFKDQTTSKPGDIHEKNHPLPTKPKLSDLFGVGGLGIAGFPVSSAPFSNQSLGRFQGSWTDYKAQLKSYNDDIRRREQEEYAREAARGGGLVGMVSMSIHGLWGLGPKMQAPPIIPQDEALTVWKNRHKDSLGELLTPPIGEIAPEVKRVQNEITDMIEKLAGPELKAKGIKVHVNLFSGDTLNAFAARNSDEWDVASGTRISEERARSNAAIASLRPVLDAEGSGGPIYELGVTAGALRKLETVDELAFLLGHELAHLLEGHTEKVNRNWLSSQSHEAVADHEAFRMMVKAGYDPAQGLRLLNRLHEGHEPPDLGSLLQGLSAGTSSHHHEGVRVAMGQMKLEHLRRTDINAQPTEVRRQLPEWMKLQTEAQLDFDPDKKLHGTTLRLAQDFMTKELGRGSWGGLAPKNSEASQEFHTAPWEAATAGRAFKDALAVIDACQGDAQKKANAALLLYFSLAGHGWKRGGPPDLKEVAAEVGEFFTRQTQAGWSADSFLKTLGEASPESRVDSQFAMRVLLSPGFQEAGLGLYEQSPEWKKLFDAAPKLLSTSRSSYSLGPKNSSLDFMTALGVLGGDRPKGDSILSEGWPKDLPGGEGRLDNVHRRNMLAHLAENARNSADWADASQLNHVLSSQSKATRAEFKTQVVAAMQPVTQKVAARQQQNLEQAFRAPGAAQALFRSAESHPLTKEQKESLTTSFLEQLRGTQQPEHLYFKNFKMFSQIMADLLNDPKLSQADKQRVTDYMLRDLPAEGLGTDNGDPGQIALQAQLARQNPADLLARALEESQRGLGLTKPPPDPGGLGGGMHTKMLGSLLGSPPRRLNPTPLLSTIGSNRTLSPKVAAGVESAQLTRWLDGLRATNNNVDTGTLLFVCDAFITHQDNIKDIDAWYQQFDELTSRQYRLLDGRAELRERFAAHLYPALLEKPPAELRDWLKRDKVTTVLKTDQTAELMARLACPDRPDGAGLDAANVRAGLANLEKEFKLQDKPALRRALHEKIAERARLQPDQMDIVFPDDVRSVSEQAKGVDKEIRGLSAMVAAARTRPPQEQLQMIEFLMGRIPDAPKFFQELDQLASAVGTTSGLNLSQLLEETRRALADADASVRVAVATSFLSGPSGMLRNEDGRKLLLNHFTAPVREQNKELATSLASVLLDAHGSQDALAVGYLLSQKSKGGQALSEGEVLNSLFDAYGVPGIKLKQYLAFTSDFAEFRHHFESSQDSAMPLSYYQAVKLVQHHYGKDWPKNWEIKDIIGSGSVNVALRFYDHEAQEMRVVSLPREQVETCSEYDFWRMGQFLDLFTKETENQSKYGFLRGLTEVIRDSVSLEFNRGAAFTMQQSVEKFYERKVGDWTVKTVKAHGLQGQAIVMEEARGRTARRVLSDRPEVYQSAMKAMASVEQDALLGIRDEKDPTPRPLHANPDFHDGQVLIDEETKTVTILDFGQAVPIDNSQREYAVDLMTIIGKGYSPEDAASLLTQRTGVAIEAGKLESILASPDQMDVFTKLLGTMAQQGAKIPIEPIHWVLGMNRQRSLGQKLDAPIDKSLRRLGAVRMTGGDLSAYNAMRIASRSPLQALRGGILGPIGGWVEKVLSEQNLLDMLKGKVKPQTLG